MITSIASGANAAASLTLVAVAGKRHKLQQLTWSYSGTPTGRITTTGLQGDQIDIDVTAGGPGALAFPPSVFGRAETHVVVTIAAGGSGVVGKLSVCSEVD